MLARNFDHDAQVTRYGINREYPVMGVFSRPRLQNVPIAGDFRCPYMG